MGRRIHRFTERAWKKALPLLTPEVIDLLVAAGRESELTADVLETSWATMHVDRRGWTCWVCESFGNRTGRALFAGSFQTSRLRNLRRHSGCQAHRIALTKMLGLPTPKSQRRRCNPKAPSKEDFAKLLAEIRKGAPVTNGTDCMEKKKACRATYCLSESLQESYRSHLSKCCTMNLLRDERKKRLQLGWRAGTVDLVIRSGSAGILKTHASGAVGITLGTQQILKNLCTRFRPPPYPSATVPEPQFDEEFFTHICKIVEAITIDSAADELTSAGDVASTEQCLREAGVEFMINLKHVLRDKAHASRRILSRPWKADPVLDAIVTLFVRGPKSISRIIQNSEDFRRWYEQHSSRSQRKKIISVFRNLRAAMHRFESLITPISRIVIDIDALISTAVQIDIERRGTSPEQARSARIFLIELTDTSLASFSWRLWLTPAMR